VLLPRSPPQEESRRRIDRGGSGGVRWRAG